MNPVIHGGLGTLILKEPFTARIALGGAIVLAGMLLVGEEHWNG